MNGFPILAFLKTANKWVPPPKRKTQLRLVYGERSSPFRGASVLGNPFQDKQPVFIDRKSRLRSVGFRSGGFPNSLTTYLRKYIVIYLRKIDNIIFPKSIIIFIQQVSSVF